MTTHKNHAVALPVPRKRAGICSTRPEKDGDVHRIRELVRSVRAGGRVMQQMVAHLGGFDRSRRLRARPFDPRARKEVDLFADGHDDRAVSVHLKDVRMERGR